MDERWNRLAPWTGVAAVALWVLAVVLLETVGGGSPAGDATASDLAAYFAEEEQALYLGGIAAMIGSALFIWFAGTLRAAVAAREPAVPRLAPLVFAGGVGTALMLMANFSAGFSAGFAANETEAPLEPAAAQALWWFKDGFFVAAGYTAALLLAATGLAALTTRVLPRWLAWLGFLLAAVALVPHVGWLALVFGLPVWTVAASLVLARGERAPVADRTAAP